MMGMRTIDNGNCMNIQQTASRQFHLLFYDVKQGFVARRRQQYFTAVLRLLCTSFCRCRRRRRRRRRWKQ